MDGFWRRNSRYFIFALVSFILLWAVYHWIAYLLPFLLGLALAYMLLPVVRWMDRRLPPRERPSEAKRAVSILLVFMAILVVSAFAVWVSVITVTNHGGELIKNATQYIQSAFEQVERWTGSLRARFRESVRTQVDAYFAGLGGAVGGALSKASPGGLSMITGSLGFIFSFAALPVFLFYILKDEERIRDSIYASLSPRAARYTRDILHIVSDTTGRYIRSLLILGLLVGLLGAAGFLLIRMPLAVPLAVFYGFFEMVPTIGLMLGNVMLAVVTLALAPEKILPVIIVALVVQQIENRILAPSIQGDALRMHPALILFLLVMGGVLWGFWGLVLTIPLASALIEIFKYLRHEPAVP